MRHSPLLRRSVPAPGALRLHEIVDRAGTRRVRGPSEPRAAGQPTGSTRRCFCQHLSNFAKLLSLLILKHAKCPRILKFQSTRVGARPSNFEILGNPKNGLLAHSEQGWYDSLEELINSAKKRQVNTASNQTSGAAPEKKRLANTASNQASGAAPTKKNITKTSKHRKLTALHF